MNTVLTFSPNAAIRRSRRAEPSVAQVRRWWTNATTRAELRRLLATGTYLVEDIGLDPAMAQAEASKPFWRA